MLSVLALQAISICVAVFAAIDVIAGAVGGCVSGAGAAFTVTVTAADAEPALLAAVSRYVVVWAGETVLDVTVETSPTPLSMLMVVPPETLQDSVAVCPAVIVDGFAANDEITGEAPGPEGVPEST